MGPSSKFLSRCLLNPCNLLPHETSFDKELYREYCLLHGKSPLWCLSVILLPIHLDRPSSSAILFSSLLPWRNSCYWLTSLLTSSSRCFMDMWNITGHNRGPSEVLWQPLSDVWIDCLFLSLQFQRDLLLNLGRGVVAQESPQFLPVWRIHFSAVQLPYLLWEVANTLSISWRYEFFLFICLRKDLVYFSLPSASCSSDSFSGCPTVFSHLVFQTSWCFLFSSLGLTLLFRLTLCLNLWCAWLFPVYCQPACFV